MDLLLELLLELLLLLLYVLYHVDTREPSCNARNKMELQERTTIRKHLYETFKQIVLQDASGRGDLEEVQARIILMERKREDEPAPQNNHGSL